MLTNLPTLEEKGAVHSPQPHDTVAGLEVSELVAPLVQEVTQALQQLTGARLNQRHYILDYTQDIRLLETSSQSFFLAFFDMY